MTRARISALALALTSVFAAQAMAATEGPMTREQVQAELAEAVRTGNVFVNETGERLRDIYPNNYPVQTATSVTREHVLAELAEAKRTGNLVVNENGDKLTDLYPSQFPAQEVATKTRDQVRAELSEAKARGELNRYIQA